MENFLEYTENVLLKFFQIPLHSSYLIYGTFALIFSAPIAFIFATIYRKIRRKFPVKVNCWFCNNNTTVPYNTINCWDCPCCNQYNGFNKDGSYNKIIEEQHDSKLNEDIFNTLKQSFSSKNNFQDNGFCKLCNINQHLKIQQLALFTPINENTYYEEVEKYREKLEKAYSLCSKCEVVLKETLEKQEYNLLQNRLNGHKQSTSTQKTKSFNKIDKKKLMQLAYKNGVIGLRWICLIVAFLQFFALIIQSNKEHHILNLFLPDSKIAKLILKSLAHYIAVTSRFNKELSFAGFASSLFLYSARQMKKDHNNLLLWGLLHISFWSSLTGVQMVLSGISVYMCAKSTREHFIYVNKNSLHKKSGFQPVKKIFPEVYNISDKEADISDQVSFPATNIKNFGLSKQNIDVKENKMCQSENVKVKDKSDLEKPKTKARKQDNEEELFLNQEKVHHFSESNGEINVSLNSSAFNKSFLASLEQEKDEAEMNGPFSEVYNGLNGLHLGDKQKKSKRASNFLCSTFAQAKNSSIIKPAKLIKNLSSTSWSESSEYNSRSSTPSSQKTEKIEPNRYDFFKTMTPISVSPFNRHSPVHCWDYDVSSGIYSNFNYFPNRFVPFQQFPGPMGHTAIYTCSRPTNFPFPFSPWQGFSNPKFSPTSPRFSDASDCDNLFQETTKNFDKSKKWFKLKRFAYYFSLFLNIFTLFGLAFFISTGIILVDWKLPNLNFFSN